MNKNFNELVNMLKRLEKEIKEKNNLYIQNSENNMPIKLEICELEKRRLEIEDELEKQRLSKLEQKVSSDLEYEVIDRQIYEEDMLDINNYFQAISKYREVQNTRLDMEIFKIQGNSMAKLKERELEIKEIEYSKLLGKFLDSFIKHQEERWEVQEYSREIIMGNYMRENINNYFDKLTNMINPKYQDNNLMDVIENDYKNAYLVSINFIDDKDIQSKICELYGIKSNEIDLFSGYIYDKRTLNDLMPDQELDDKKPIGNTIIFYGINKRNGQIRQLCSMINNNKWSWKSTNKQLKANREGTNINVNEILTIGCNGIELTFYEEKSGTVHLGRREGEAVSEISTKTVEEYYREKEKDKKRRNRNFKV